MKNKTSSAGDQRETLSPINEQGEESDAEHSDNSSSMSDGESESTSDEEGEVSDEEGEVTDEKTLMNDVTLKLMRKEN